MTQKRKTQASLGFGIGLLGFCAVKQISLGPGSEALAVQILFLAILLSALLGFLKGNLKAPATLLLIPLASYDICLAIQPPLPKILVWMYTALAGLGTLLYLSIDSRRIEELHRGVPELLHQSSVRLYRNILLGLIPLWASAWVFARSSSQTLAPLHPRVIHPAPPAQIRALENPYRLLEKKDPEAFEAIVEQGKALYAKNCLFCHGDNLDGKGHFAAALNPLPANFRDPGTIAMLQESFVFWRVAQGGPGLPPEAHPWNSMMPVWEKMLSEEEIWQVITWLYAGTGYEPRTWEKQAE